MKYLTIPLLVIAFSLTGCAGVNSEFECNATTSDSCMTIEEANEKAKSVTDTSKVTPAADVSLTPANTALPKVAPLSLAVSESRQNEKMAELIEGLKHSAGTLEHASKEMANKPLVTLASCTVTTCPQEKKITAHRLNEGIARLWVAPYIDTDEVLHQPGHIFFVVKPSTWQQIQSVN